MRLAFIAFVLVAGGLWLATSPTPTLADQHTSTCESCAKKSSGSCPHCESGEGCPHCDQGKSCPHCAHHGKHGYHGKWAGHQWEYKCVRPSKKPVEMTKQFNGLGAERWRLKGVDGGVWCFARVKRSD